MNTATELLAQALEIDRGQFWEHRDLGDGSMMATCNNHRFAAAIIAAAPDGLVICTRDELASERERIAEAVRGLRTYARHDPLCKYHPTYPDGPVASCDCGFDAVLAAIEGKP